MAWTPKHNASSLRMCTRAFTHAARATLAGTMASRRLSPSRFAPGVEYYHVDFAGLCK
jgi:hypothetical protein